MIQTILWAISFVGLWTAIVWLNFLYLPEPKRAKIKVLPKVTIAIPSYNEENTLAKTVQSITELDYPINKLDIIIVNDGSKDKTAEVAKSLIEKYKNSNIQLINQKNQGKGEALNNALSNAKGELFGCLDADTFIERCSLKKIVPHFNDKNVGATISLVKVDSPKNFFEKIQRIEYVCSNFFRRLMSNVATLSITPGVLSVYNAGILRKVGGFKYGAGTEDLEIALRLKSNHYDVQMEKESKTHTKVPKTWSALWTQRVRWYRGFFYNHWKYRHIFFNRKYDLFGMYQLPMSVVGIFLMLVTVGLISYSGGKDLFEFVYRSLTIDGYFWTNLLDFPTLKQAVLGHNLQVMFPIYVATVLGVYLLYIGHKQLKERMFINTHFLAIYVVAFPYVIALHWMSAIFQEVFRTKRKW